MAKKLKVPINSQNERFDEDFFCEIDQEKIIMTGNSGGGVLTAYTSALDERIKISLPSCSFTSITSTNGYIFHCDCCAIPSICLLYTSPSPRDRG